MATIPLTDRQETILRTLVRRYLATGAPVASREVVEAGVAASSATVRAEFQVLTEAGLLAKPHAAAGRLPSESAIRRYAHEIVGRGQLPLLERSRLDHAMTALKDGLELLLEETSRLLYEQTACVGLVVAPKEQYGVIERIRLTPLDNRSLLVALVFSWGKVETLVTPLAVEPGKLDLPTLERFLMQELSGRALSDLEGDRLERAFALAKQRSFAHRAICEPIERFVGDLITGGSPRLVSSGVVALAGHPAFDGQDQLRALLRLAQDPTFAPEVFFDMNPSRPGARVRIGDDLGHEFSGLAVVWAPFGRGDLDAGKVGVFGPVRLPYDRAIPMVEYLALSLEKALPGPSMLAS